MFTLHLPVRRLPNRNHTPLRPHHHENPKPQVPRELHRVREHLRLLRRRRRKPVVQHHDVRGAEREKHQLRPLQVREHHRVFLLQQRSRGIGGRPQLERESAVNSEGYGGGGSVVDVGRAVGPGSAGERFEVGGFAGEHPVYTEWEGGGVEVAEEEEIGRHGMLHRH